ncbi:MAG: 3-hydroxyacyl-ACP dehydratase FabZ family protein [Gemmatimonadales bacterium]
MTAVRYERAELGATYLPVGKMLQLDRVLEVLGDRIVAAMDIKPEHWVFAEHFPGDPIFPGSFLIEAAGQLVALWGWEVGLRGRPRMAKASAQFENPVLAEDGTVTLRAQVRRRRNMCFGAVEVQSGERKVATVEVVIVVVNGTDPVTPDRGGFAGAPPPER